MLEFTLILYLNFIKLIFKFFNINFLKFHRLSFLKLMPWPALQVHLKF